LKIWIVGVHREASFKVVATAESKEEAIKLAKALTSLGEPMIWEAETVEAE